MTDAGTLPSRFGLAAQGLATYQVAHWNLGVSQLIEKAIERHEGSLSADGAFVVQTGQFTGRSPKDKYIVRNAATDTTVDWGDVNQPMLPEAFGRIHRRLLHFLEQCEDLFVQDCFAGADPAYALPIRVITQRAWHSLFARQLFVRPNPAETKEHNPQFTV